MHSCHGPGHRHLNLEKLRFRTQLVPLFVRMHNFPIDPTPDTLSFFTVYMSHHIKPSSVDNYLSGICQQLEPYFPSVRKARKSMICTRTLTGCKRLRGVPTKRKCALSMELLSNTIPTLMTMTTYFSLLKCSQVFSRLCGWENL